MRLESSRDKEEFVPGMRQCFVRENALMSYVYPFELADKRNCIFIHGKRFLYLNGFSLFGEINLKIETTPEVCSVGQVLYSHCDALNLDLQTRQQVQ